MILYTRSLAEEFAVSSAAQVKVEQTSDGTAFRAELQCVDSQDAGFMKVELH